MYRYVLAKWFTKKNREGFLNIFKGFFLLEIIQFLLEKFVSICSYFRVSFQGGKMYTVISNYVVVRISLSCNVSPWKLVTFHTVVGIIILNKRERSYLHELLLAASSNPRLFTISEPF